MNELIYKKILYDEGLSDWTIKWNTGGGLCVYSKKEIWMDNDRENIALFLHEIAHALCPKEVCGICWVDDTGHNSIWADKFTRLVKKYLRNVNL